MSGKRGTCFVSTCAANRRTPPYLFTELGVLRWSVDESAWQLIERHAGTTVQEVQDRTGFRVLAIGPVPEIPEPPAEMRETLSQVDPRRIRDLDFASSAADRQQRMLEIEAQEHTAAMQSARQPK